MAPSLPLAAGLSAAVALGGWAARALTLTGALAAVGVGTAILFGAGWPGAVALAVFFVGSSAVSRIPGAPARTSDAKGDRRDAIQVLANGGAAAVAAVAFRANPVAAIWIVTASLSAAAADTWATETGIRSRIAPRRLLFGAAVPSGTNGGMTVRGTVGGLAGAASVALVTGAVTGDAPLAMAATVIGMLGMVADSLLGATVQARFQCPGCGLDTEHRTHRCGTRTTHTGGIAWLGNDGVNMAATTLAALGGLAAYRWLAT